MNALCTNMFPVEEISEPTCYGRFTELLKEPLPRFKGELVRKGEQLYAAPKGLKSILNMSIAQEFILE